MKIQTPKKCHTIIWWYAIQKFSLSQIEILLITLISGLSRNKGCCYASKDYLAQVLNVSTTTIYNTMKKLFKKELLERAPKGNFVTNPIRPTQNWKTLVRSIKESLG